MRLGVIQMDELIEAIKNLPDDALETIKELIRG